MQSVFRAPRISFRLSAILAAAVLLMLETGPASAAIISLTASPTSPITPGSTNNSFDVIMTSDAAVNIWAFMFELTAASADITLTHVTTTDQPLGSGSELSNYIFKGHSDVTTNWGGVSSLSGPGQNIMAADAYVPIDPSDPVEPSYVSLTAYESVALGRVWFDVSPGANRGSIITLSFNADATNFATGTDPYNLQTEYLAGNQSPIPLNVENGPLPVPEPTSLTILLGLMATGGVFWRRRMR